MDITVAFLVFNRPSHTARVFAEIARARPQRLMIVADGPRHPEERARCDEVRAIVERVDWDCEVLRNYSDTNMGCRRRVSSGLDWVFARAEEAIVLEDDCLPHPSFFPYAQALLQRYQDTEKVMHVSGNNFMPWVSPRGQSYFFSRYNFSWGWATWRRAWCHFSPDISVWRDLREQGWLESLVADPRERCHWRHVFDEASNPSQTHIWDAQWLFACWRHGGLSALPAVNLVSNIGFGGEASHTQDPHSVLADRPTRAMRFPLRHPALVQGCERADQEAFERVFLLRGSGWHRLRAKLLSRWTYGAWIRRLPVAGAWWARWRQRRAAARIGQEADGS